MQPHYARVTRTETNQGVLLSEGSLLFLVSFQMCLVNALDGVLLAGREELPQPDL